MKSKKIILSILIVLALIIAGYFKVSREIKPATEKFNRDMAVLEIKSRDAKRVSDIKILNTTIQIYALDKEKLPTKKDEKGNFVPFNLTKDSSDYNNLESEINGYDKTLHISSDPSTDRYYSYFSDGKIYSIKAYLEQENTQGCKVTKPGFCEFEIKGDLESILK